MDKGKRHLATPLLAAACLTALTAPLHAVTYVEPASDAGQTLATAANTGSTLPTLIQGTIAGPAGTTANPSDADLYQLTVATAGSYTFSTVNTYTDAGGVDTELSLFSSTGTAILENDDASGTTTDSSITTTLTAGTYYLGVSSSDNEPVNANNQLLFTGLNQSGDTTAVRGAASGVNPTTLSGYNGNEYDMTTTGRYQIGITAPAAVPEPSTWATVAFGGIASAMTFLRRRRQQAA